MPESLSQLLNLHYLSVSDCKKLEVLPKLPPSLTIIGASDCTSLREVLGSSRDPFSSSSRYLNYFQNCPNLFKNVPIDSEGSISKTRSLDSATNLQGVIHQLSAFLGFVGFETNRCGFFSQNTYLHSELDIVYCGNSIPKWFTNRSTENHVKVKLPSDWCYDKFLGFGTCVVLKCKRPGKFKGYSVKNFDGASLFTENRFPPLRTPGDFWKDEVIWLRYRRYTKETKNDKRDVRSWKEAKNFVTCSFEENNEYVEVKECGATLICDEDIQQGTHLSMLQDLPTPTQHGGMLSLEGGSELHWSW